MTTLSAADMRRDEEAQPKAMTSADLNALIELFQINPAEALRLAEIEGKRHDRDRRNA